MATVVLSTKNPNGVVLELYIVIEVPLILHQFVVPMDHTVIFKILFHTITC